MNAYERLLQKSREIVILSSATAVLGWDFETYMPPKGMNLRSEQGALLQRILHQLKTDPENAEIIKAIQSGHKHYDAVQERNIYLFKKEYEEATRLPESLVSDIAKQSTIAVTAWKKAKSKKDWSLFKPELMKTIELHKKRAELLMEVKGAKTLYDAMIDDFEPGMTQDVITKVFDELKAGLIPLTKKCTDASSSLDTSYLSRPVPIEVQRKMAFDIAKFLDYDITSENAGGRIDETEHPFTTGYYDDVRVTVHYHENNVASALYALLHEIGHALYEQNLNPEWKYQPIGEAASMGIHESMSRFVENIVGRTEEFWKFYFPKLNQITSNKFADIDLMDFIRSMNIVKPSKIRIEADEVTYSLHVIIRFEIERDLMADRIEVSELPQIWNEKYEKYLGVEIENDSEGVMQDTHWASGLIGYFPSYALGNVYDGMWLEKINSDIPNWRENISQGDFLTVKNWLVENIHRKARLYEPNELAMKLTGKQLTAKPFIEYLNDKYSRLFGL